MSNKARAKKLTQSTDTVSTVGTLKNHSASEHLSEFWFRVSAGLLILLVLVGLIAASIYATKSDYGKLQGTYDTMMGHHITLQEKYMLLWTSGAHDFMWTPEQLEWLELSVYTLEDK